MKGLGAREERGVRSLIDSVGRVEVDATIVPAGMEVSGTSLKNYMFVNGTETLLGSLSVNNIDDDKRMMGLRCRGRVCRHRVRKQSQPRKWRSRDGGSGFEGTYLSSRHHRPSLPSVSLVWPCNNSAAITSDHLDATAVTAGSVATLLSLPWRPSSSRVPPFRESFPLSISFR